ncbi:MAG: hypothetical protein EBV19_10310, partial [Flavobacteriia bacterium]|nr:hypothetical protein [Flavobacteriia bacterium]
QHAKVTMMFAKMGYEPYEDGDEIVLADIPGAVTSFVDLAFGGKIGAATSASHGWEKAVGMVILFVLVTAAMVAINQAVRRIPIQYAQRMVGRKMYGAQTNYLPLKVNYAGVMPVIFAGAILSFPPMLLNPLSTLSPQLEFLRSWADVFCVPILSLTYSYFNWDYAKASWLPNFVVILIYFFWLVRSCAFINVSAFPHPLWIVVLIFLAPAPACSFYDIEFRYIGKYFSESFF